MRRHFATALLLAVAVFPAVGAAASFRVAPVRVTLSADQPTTAITITANGTTRQTMQLETVVWTQRDGEDIYRPTEDLLVTPPIFELQPGEKRIIRIGLHHAAPASEETAYRLYIREIPPPRQRGAKGVRVALRIGIPVFVLPKDTVQPVLQWRAQRQPQGGLRLELVNRGKAHVQLAELRLREADGESSQLIASGAFYLLAGQARQWFITPEAAARLYRKQLRLLLVTDQGQHELELNVEEP